MHRLAFALAALLVLAVRAGAMDITTCGQTVPQGEIGVLQADLDCSSFGANSVTLGLKATLDMNGHSIASSSVGGAILCFFGGLICQPKGGTTVCHGHKGSCTVTSSVGRGRVVAPPGGGPGIGGERDIVLQNLDVVGTSIGGTKLTATDVSVTNVPGASVGIFVERKATLTRVESSGGYLGIYGLAADVKGTDVVVQNNRGGGISAARVRITHLTAVGNGTEPSAAFGAGVAAGKVFLFDSTLTGNSYQGRPVDILAAHRPRIFNTTCDHSEVLDFSQTPSTWGVCASD